MVGQSCFPWNLRYVVSIYGYTVIKSQYLGYAFHICI